MELTAYWEGDYRVRVPVRGFEIVSDEPVEFGGADAGPTPTELLVSSMAVCFTMALVHAFRKRRRDLPDVAVKVSAGYDGLRLSRFRVVVHSSLPRTEIEALMDRAIGYCYVSNTLLGDPQIEYEVADGPLTPTPAAPPS
ncbi:MAG TPA: OsmC family protein [Actinomycetota bacterium]|jgi:putative redox protein|nr:OsmC family protein [Actinomycetota bacterium]